MILYKSNNLWKQMATFNDLTSVPEDDNDDFHPLRMMLSMTLQINLACKTGVLTNYSVIGKYDPALWAHPLVADKECSTRNWYTGMTNGRSTPGK
jgi:hypothetical protein